MLRYQSFNFLPFIFLGFSTSYCLKMHFFNFAITHFFKFGFSMLLGYIAKKLSMFFGKMIMVLSSFFKFFALFFFKAKNADFYSQYVTEDFTTYINRKRMDSCHGNHLEIQAMTELFNRPVEVYQYSLGNLSFLPSLSIYICVDWYFINLQPKDTTLKFGNRIILIQFLVFACPIFLISGFFSSHTLSVEL